MFSFQVDRAGAFWPIRVLAMHVLDRTDPVPVCNKNTIRNFLNYFLEKKRCDSPRP